MGFPVENSIECADCEMYNIGLSSDAYCDECYKKALDKAEQRGRGKAFEEAILIVDWEIEDAKKLVFNLGIKLIDIFQKEINKLKPKINE